MRTSLAGSCNRALYYNVQSPKVKSIVPWWVARMMFFFVHAPRSLGRERGKLMFESTMYKGQSTI